MRRCDTKKENEARSLPHVPQSQNSLNGSSPNIYNKSEFNGTRSASFIEVIPDTGENFKISCDIDENFVISYDIGENFKISCDKFI